MSNITKSDIEKLGSSFNKELKFKSLDNLWFNISNLGILTGDGKSLDKIVLDKRA